MTSGLVPMRVAMAAFDRPAFLSARAFFFWPALDVSMRWIRICARSAWVVSGLEIEVPVLPLRGLFMVPAAPPDYVFGRAFAAASLADELIRAATLWCDRLGIKAGPAIWLAAAVTVGMKQGCERRADAFECASADHRICLRPNF
jgi:hypothetical protein